MILEQYARAADGTPLHWRSLAPPGLDTHPAVVLLPGGGFHALFGIPPAVSQSLAQAGFMVFNNTEYRIAPPNKLAGQTSDGRFPCQTNDVELAIAAAQADSRCNGTVFAIGGSAGASHAAYLAAKGLVKAAVCLSPATQFDDPASLQNGIFSRDVTNYAPNNFLVASPNNMLVTDESPIFLVAFEQDNMPAPQFEIATTHLALLGAPSESRLLPGSGHSWDAWVTVKDQAIAFLNARR